MRRHPLRERGLIAPCALALAGLLGACATNKGELRDESAERIEAIIRPGQAPEPIPEGITLGPDAPPLSGSHLDGSLALAGEPLDLDAESPLLEEESGVRSGPHAHPLAPFAWGVPSVPCQRPPHGAILPAPVPLSCLLNPGAIEFRIQPRPGGSIPGLLP
ncbi:hypothetical protein ACLESD_35815 [Pyxidicoccus sp. 3LFB2]